MKTSILIQLPSDSESLPDTSTHTDRFNVRSDSGSIYLIARDIKSRKFSCNCMGWITKRKCKHLVKTLGIPIENIHGNDGIPANEIIVTRGDSPNSPIMKIHVNNSSKVLEKKTRLIDFED